ncbi:hypothetical protein BKA80DRAFT_269222 [Phyllosticta citrichinensis]
MHEKPRPTFPLHTTCTNAAMSGSQTDPKPDPDPDKTRNQWDKMEALVLRLRQITKLQGQEIDEMQAALNDVTNAKNNYKAEAAELLQREQQLDQQVAESDEAYDELYREWDASTKAHYNEVACLRQVVVKQSEVINQRTIMIHPQATPASSSQPATTTHPLSPTKCPGNRRPSRLPAATG